MTEIIKNDRIVDDSWRVLRLEEGESPETVDLPPEPTLFPLSVWRARKAALLSRAETAGVWLASIDTPEEIADGDGTLGILGILPIVGIDFPKFSDGRGYSSARLLRERFHFKGEIRAIGDVLQDQLFLMKRCGIDAYAVRPDKDIRAALTGLTGFSESYQGGVDEPLPLFRRRKA
ncbi:MAG: DUF934 domain-containing protein [Candidatus Accumulibacter sp.]|jgi:uncharacterized protein (DUF934 family)|nr:DUF934 domain-containing protein [Accumulibacter sp.]